MPHEFEHIIKLIRETHCDKCEFGRAISILLLKGLPQPKPEVTPEPVVTKRKYVRKVTTQTKDVSALVENECVHCHTIKPWVEFPKNPTYKSGHTNKCKDCTNHSKNKNESPIDNTLAAIEEETKKFKGDRS